ncbi:MAG: folylpolyglutamate synthase/dihydrofolate synthase family protein [Bacteroidales bacterium]
MTYQETIDFLYSKLPVFHRVGKAAYKDGLGNTLLLDEYFNHPHRKFKCIHVAGTNGKGSVSHMLAAVLMEAGYKTGLYTSPHLRDFRERIRVNGEMISQEEVVRFVADHTNMIAEVQPSFFELTVAMAFNYFAQMEVDVAVVEVGLGGRLDSTNIILPVCSVITNISWDHTDLLGDSLEKIATEKAGIIKPGVPVIIGEETEATREVFIQKANREGSKLLFAENEFLSLGEEVTQGGIQRFQLRGKDGLEFFPELDLLGKYQRHNILTVFACITELQQLGFNIPMDKVTGALRNVTTLTGLQGRWQIIQQNPLVICDTGHNAAGIKEVMNQLVRVPCEKLHIVFGVVSDKPLSQVLELLPKNAHYYFTRADIPRALQPERLQQEAARFGLRGGVSPDVRSACREALSVAGINDLVFVGGSTFVVADFLRDCLG